MARERAPQVQALDDVLKARTAPGELYQKLDGGKLRCYACGHRCLIQDGHDGICKVRYNRGGTLYVPRNYAAGLQVDPIEKKPFFHAFPGAVALSFGMLGCDFHCANCQNWLTSQVLRDPEALAPPRDITADQVVGIATAHKAPVIVSTYNEPLITSEWAVEVFKLAKPAGITCGFVSNGNGTPEVLEYLRPWINLYKVDLKSFRDKNYRQLGGTLEAVTRTIESLWKMGVWVEIVTLVIPGFNDSNEELTDTAQFLAGISPDIPWHVTAFHKDYKMQGPANTSVGDLLRACEIGASAGLRYVYAGNLPGRVGPWEDTRCPKCHETVVKRFGYHVREYRITDEGTCRNCRHRIAGYWTSGWEVPANDGGLPGRIPRAVRIP